jgi:hypothetical protein
MAHRLVAGSNRRKRDALERGTIARRPGTIQVTEAIQEWCDVRTGLELDPFS